LVEDAPEEIYKAHHRVREAIDRSRAKTPRIRKFDRARGARKLARILHENGTRMPDYMYLLESRLSAEQRAAVVRIQELAAAPSPTYILSAARSAT